MSARERPTSASGRRSSASVVVLTICAALGVSACEEPQPVMPVAAPSTPRSTSRFAAPTVEVHVLPAPEPAPQPALAPAAPANVALAPRDPPHVVGGVVGGVIGGVIGGTIGNVEPKRVDGTLVVPFGAGMSRPSRISGRDPIHSQKAREAKVEGTALVKCVMERDGALSHCELVKGLPFMSDEILSAVKTWRFTPVISNGQPIRVFYTIPIRLRFS